MTSDNATIIAITGGIGAGKSVVATLLLNAGYSVYDCDSKAKILMSTSPVIRKALTHRFGHSVYNHDNTLNRQVLSDIIFYDNDALAFVNSVVHPVVRDDIASWSIEQERQPVFVETALLKEGNMEHMMTQVWNVTAPLEVRVNRVMKRNNASREQVERRIRAQSTYSSSTLPVHNIINDGISPILPQVMRLLSITN